MFTDIVGSTALIEAIGDQAWEDLRRWHDEALRQRFGEHGGEELDHTGDGFFVAFPDAESAIRCATDIQRALAENRLGHGFAPQVRIGVHAAEATRSVRTFSGHGVHAAARIAAQAEGGEVLVSGETLAASSHHFPVAHRRSVKLKGITREVEVASVDWR